MVSRLKTPFPRSFRALTTYDPFPWQTELYARFMENRLPEACDVPTGLGKTCVIPIWIIALAEMLRNGSRKDFPRRLIYVVNRRTVVDQATEEATRLRARLTGLVQTDPEDARILGEIRECLLTASASRQEPCVAISTLRGELADNAEWKLDPARPAIIIGTIDMVGSKLLFSGYGDSFRLRPHHAGLIGQDALFLHDEAHLEPAFSVLLAQVRTIQQCAQEPRPIVVMDLSATPLPRRDVLSLSEDDRRDQRVTRRMAARKSLDFRECETEALADTLASLATTHEKKRCRVLIYVRKPELARAVTASLLRRIAPPAETRVALLTGTLRGHERDLLAEQNQVFRAFRLRDQPLDSTVYLVSTSAGEVGLNLDADHMVCDLAPLDSMIQRLGRVNRYGEGDARVDLVVPQRTQQAETEDPWEQVLAGVTEHLRRLPSLPDGGRDASPRALRELAGDRLGRTAGAQSLPLHDIDLDAWTLTSLGEELAGRKPVAPWLHGIAGDPPDTYVTWRAEVSYFRKYKATGAQIRDWFAGCPILSRERLREPTATVIRKLKLFAQRYAGEEFPVVVLDQYGELAFGELTTLTTLLQKPAGALEYCTLVLPADRGGVDDYGAFDPVVRRPLPQTDVADFDGSRVRFLIRQAGGESWYRTLLEDSESGPVAEPLSELMADLAQQEGMVPEGLIALGPESEDGDDDGERCYLLLLTRATRVPLRDNKLPRGQPPADLATHSRQVTEWMERICDALALFAPLKEALLEAARWHDRGKDRSRWQRAAGNPGEEPLAKPGPGGMIAALLAGYRHELGSLLDACGDEALRRHPERELILHLIAAHHGRARPHFEPQAWDTERYNTLANQEAVWEAICRFARMQQPFGRWGLAWLEALLRCADALASQAQVGGES